MKTPITYFGGKQSMLKHILPLIPEHNLYTEAFCGGCAVLFAKEPVKAEIINDINTHVTNFFWIAKTEFKALKKEIDKTVHARETHTHARHILDHPLYFSGVERAWAVWCLSKISFASMLNGTFGYDFHGTMPTKVRNAKKYFTKELCDRLERVTIECKDALDVIKRYDRDDAFHFIDPPYIGTACAHYTGSFNENNLIELLDQLVLLKGKFMLTMFPNEQIKNYAISNKWMIHKIERTISASKGTRRKQEEWIICNYNL